MGNSIIVDLPDGSEAEFPEGTPLPTIQAAIQKKFPPKQNMAPPQPSEPSVNMGEYNTGASTPESYSRDIRRGIPAAAGLAAGSIPVAGIVAGPLAAATTDLAMSKLYSEGNNAAPRETSFLTDVGVGLIPSVGKAAMKLIPAPIESRISSAIRTGIQKAIRPTTAGKSTYGQTEQYFNKAQSAVETIVQNKPNLKLTDEMGNIVPGLPKTLNQFSQSIDQTKRSIFNQYNDMAKTTEGLGLDVDTTPVLSELASFGKDKVNNIVGGGGLARSKELFNGLQQQRLTPLETQELIAKLNDRLTAYYRNPSSHDVSVAVVDALTANKLRSSLDATMEQSGYQALKNQYGALSSIEKEVNQRAIVDASKNIKGLIDFSDIASAAEAARAIASAGSGHMFSAAAIKGMSSWYKYINNPNRIVGSMFGEVDKLMAQKAARSTVPPALHLLGPTPQQ